MEPMLQQEEPKYYLLHQWKISLISSILDLLLWDKIKEVVNTWKVELKLKTKYTNYTRYI